MKKIITLALTLALALSLVACGGDTAPESSTPTPAGTGSEAPAGTGGEAPAGTGGEAPAGTGSEAPAGTGSEAPESTNTPDPASPQAPSSGTPVAGDSTAAALWTGSYTGDGVKIRLYENSNGTVDSTIEEQSRHNPTLTIIGNNTATATLLVPPEAHGGDMAVNDARNTFPNIDYSYTLTLHGSQLTYHRTTTLTALGEEFGDAPEQVMEFTATLSRNNTNK